MIRFIFLGILIFGAFQLSAQLNSEQELKKAIAHLEEESKQQLKTMHQQVQSTRLSSNASFFIDLAIKQLQNTQLPQLKTALERIEKKRNLPNLNKSKLLNLESRFLDLIQEKEGLQNLQAVLFPTFQNSRSDNFKKELAFYQLKNHQRIGELGAGDALFAAYVSTRLDQTSYYINEIDLQAIQHIKKRIPYFFGVKNKFATQLGSTHSTALEGQALDKILIRNAIHHFSDINAMLSAIKSSLDEEGLLYLKEAFKEECEINCCPDLLSKHFLIKTLRQHGFILKASETLLEEGNTWHLMAFEREDI